MHSNYDQPCWADSTPDLKTTQLNINTRSINNKKTDLLNIIAQSQPDIIVATVTWLKLTVISSEVIPPNYVAYSKDRTDGYGRVMIVIKSCCLLFK